jgi:hypothetical protein
VDAVIEKLKGLLGDAWTDELGDELRPVVDEATGSAVSAAVASGIDGEKAKRLKSDTALKASVARVAELEEQLASAGDTDEALEAARKAVAEATARSEAVASQLRGRDIADAARTALAGSKIDERTIPAERMGAAMKMLPLDGVDIDESGDVVGIEASLTTLKEREGWLWADAEQKGGGHGGKRTGGEPAPKVPKPKEGTPRETGRALCDLAFENAHGKRTEVQA